MALFMIHSSGGSTEDTRRFARFRGRRSGGSQPLGHQIIVVHASHGVWEVVGGNTGETPISGHL